MNVRWTAALLIVMVVMAPEVPAQNSSPDSPQSLQRKMQELQERIQKWEKEGRAVGHVMGKSFWEFRQLMKQSKLKEAEAVLDRALRMRPLPSEKNEAPRTESGGLIALGDRDDQGRDQILTVSLQDSSRKQLTHGPEEHWMPAWSPDGKKIAYVSRSQHGMKIYLMNADGSSNQQLTTEGISMAPRWSPDGKRIVYAHAKPKPKQGARLKIWVMNADGTDKQQITKGDSDDNVPTWSSDGKRIAFTSNREVGKYQIWVMDVDGENLKALTKAYYDKKLEADIEQKVPSWSPDGRYIAFWSGVEATDPRPNLPRDVWVMKADGSDQKRLTPGDDPEWSPDSKTITFPTVGRDWRLAVGGISPDGSGKRVLFTTNGSFGRTSWQSAQGVFADEPKCQVHKADFVRQLSSGPGQSRTTFNFARGLAADESRRVHAVWHTAQDGRSQVYYRRSADGGKSWENSQRLSGEEGSHEHPSIAEAGDNVFVVWHGFGSEGKPYVCLRMSDDGGRTWLDAKVICDRGGAHASVAVVDKIVHLIWKDSRDGDTEVYYRRSTDAGQTFGEEERLTDAPVISYVPSLAASGQIVALAWVDTRDGNEEEYIKVSTDGGATWGPDTRVTDNRMNSWAPSVAVEGQTIHLVWFDQKDTQFHLYGAEAKLDEALRLVGLESESPPQGVHIPGPEQTAKLRATEKMKKIQMEAPRWIGAGGDPSKLQVIMKEFDEMGQPVGLLAHAEKALDKALGLIGANVDLPQKEETNGIEAIQRRMQAKVRRVEQNAPNWVQGGGDPQQLQALMQNFQEALQRAQQTGSYVNKERKLDEALKLMNISFAPTLPDKLPVSYYGDALQSRVQAKQRQLTAAAPRWVRQGGSQQRLEGLLKQFERRMRIATLEWDIYYRRSDDTGKTWTNEQRTVGVPGNSHRPQLAVLGRELHLVWWDNRDGNDEIYYKHSANGGRTWGDDVRLTNTAGASQFPMIATTKSGPHVIWTEQADGNSQVYYRRYKQ